MIEVVNCNSGHGLNVRTMKREIISCRLQPDYFYFRRLH